MLKNFTRMFGLHRQHPQNYWSTETRLSLRQDSFSFLDDKFKELLKIVLGKQFQFFLEIHTLVFYNSSTK